MKYALIVVCVALFLFHIAIWLSSEVNENENSAIASSIYFLCFILVWIFT